MKRWYAHQLFIAVDQLVNVAFSGWADETISARAYRLGVKAQEAKQWTVWRAVWAVVDKLFFPQDLWLRYRDGVWPVIKHCQRAYVSEKTRAQLPPEYRNS